MSERERERESGRERERQRERQRGRETARLFLVSHPETVEMCVRTFLFSTTCCAVLHELNPERGSVTEEELPIVNECV